MKAGVECGRWTERKPDRQLTSHSEGLKHSRPSSLDSSGDRGGWHKLMWGHCGARGVGWGWRISCWWSRQGREPLFIHLKPCFVRNGSWGPWSPAGLPGNLPLKVVGSETSEGWGKLAHWIFHLGPTRGLLPSVGGRHWKLWRSSFQFCPGGDFWVTLTHTWSPGSCPKRSRLLREPCPDQGGFSSVIRQAPHSLHYWPLLALSAA